MNLISKTLTFIGENYPNVKAIQIGAMDGISFDDTRGWFDRYSWNTVLVEPIPDLFNELKINLKDRKNLIFENVAIGPEDRTVKMLTIPSSTVELNNLHPGYKGMSAVYPLKNGFGSTYQRDIEVKEKYGIDINVPMITFDKLVYRNGFENVDILICDAEGYDWEIFKTIDLTKYKLKFIRLEYINLTDEEKELLKDKLEKSGYYYEINGQDIDIVSKSLLDQIDYIGSGTLDKDNITIVSGLWNIEREGRPFEEVYLPRFKTFLKIDKPMILFLPKELHSVVWEVRKKDNTNIITLELEDLKTGLFQPHWDSCQKIRTSEKWGNKTGTSGWLKKSPQYLSEWYNPIVMSKMFMLHDASIYNTFNTEYFYWVDAGLNITVHEGALTHSSFYEKLTNFTDPFLFISFPYKPAGEIHGLDQTYAERLVGKEIEYVCRGGLFGGHKQFLSQANGTYYALLNRTLTQGYMGTEESIFTIMSYLEPHNYRRYMIGSHGLLIDFYDAVLNNTAQLVDLPNNIQKYSRRILSSQNYKTNLYILTFNFPEQLEHILKSFEKTPEWLEKPNLILLDNSTNDSAVEQNKIIAEKYNFEHIHLGENKGICGGRQYAAEHFDNSDADFYFFFEDDMTIHSKEEEGLFCRNGFRKYIPNLYSILHKIILREDFDFLKLSFTEVYWDNNIQTSWYNVPQKIRTEVWPDYDQLPVTGNDPNAPRTKFERIDNLQGVSYITGEVFYCNWPMIVSKKGNKKMFIDTKWDYPFEQTWMSHMFQETLKGNIKPAVLLASPINHQRIKHYEPTERREN